MHSEFKISRTLVQSGTKHMEGTWSQLTYTIQLERQPLFMMMNLVVPIYIISVSNLLVFLLPLDSSDRVAFSVTMLLTFTVLQTFVDKSRKALPSRRAVKCEIFLNWVNLVVSLVLPVNYPVQPFSNRLITQLSK
jgi:hypothetical protein